MSTSEDSAPLTVAHSEEGARLVVSVAGEMDVAAVPHLEAALGGLRPLPLPIAFDLAGVSFLDSSGLRALLQARAWSMEDTGTAADIRHASEPVVALLRISGMHGLFALPDSD